MTANDVTKDTNTTQSVRSTHSAQSTPGAQTTPGVQTGQSTRRTPAGRIVAGVDFSDNAARAVSWAAGEAVDRGLALHLVHALNLPGPMGDLVEPAGYASAHHADAEALLARTTAAVRDEHPLLVVDSEISEIGAAESLVALSGDAKLVVTGTRGHGGFTGMLLGSVSLKVAAHAHCPTVVVRGERTERPLDEIVLGVEPDQAEAPIRFAFQTAATFGATLTAVRVWWPYNEYSGYYFAEVGDDRGEQERQNVTDLLKAVHEDYPGVTVRVEAVRGNSVPLLIEAAQNARMVVVGSHRRHGPLSVGAGYVVQGLLAHSAAPVAVVPIA